MKNFYFLFVMGLLACAGTREDRTGFVFLEQETREAPETNIDLPAECSLPWEGTSADGRGESIITRSASDTTKNKSDDKKPKPFFHKIDTSLNGKTIPTFESDGGFNFFRAPRKIFDEHKTQQFDVRVTITFPRMTLQQAAELEARVRKIFPEAQEIDFGLEKKVEVPAESFYYDMPDGVEFRILPGLTFPLQDLKNGNILKADSTGTPAWKVF